MKPQLETWVKQRIWGFSSKTKLYLESANYRFRCRNLEKLLTTLIILHNSQRWKLPAISTCLIYDWLLHENLQETLLLLENWQLSLLKLKFLSHAIVSYVYSSFVFIINMKILSLILIFFGWVHQNKSWTNLSSMTFNYDFPLIDELSWKFYIPSNFLSASHKELFEKKLVV